MKYDIESWERVIFTNSHSEDKFIKEFIGDEVDVMTVSSVFWNSCSMKINFILDDGQHMTDTFSIFLWEEYYNEKI